MRLHEKIRAVRKAKGISQTHVAELAGMTLSNYNMKELGKRTITAEELEVIASALGESASIFYDEKFHEKWNTITA